MNVRTTRRESRKKEGIGSRKEKIVTREYTRSTVSTRAAAGVCVLCVCVCVKEREREREGMRRESRKKEGRRSRKEKIVTREYIRSTVSNRAAAGVCVCLCVCVCVREGERERERERG